MSEGRQRGEVPEWCVDVQAVTTIVSGEWGRRGGGGGMGAASGVQAVRRQPKFSVLVSSVPRGAGGDVTD